MPNNTKSNRNESAKFALRLPSCLYGWVRELADEEHRSINAQIVSIIEQAKQDKQQKPTHRQPAP